MAMCHQYENITNSKTVSDNGNAKRWTVIEDDIPAEQEKARQKLAAGGKYARAKSRGRERHDGKTKGRACAIETAKANEIVDVKAKVDAIAAGLPKQMGFGLRSVEEESQTVGKYFWYILRHSISICPNAVDTTTGTKPPNERMVHPVSKSPLASDESPQTWPLPTPPPSKILQTSDLRTVSPPCLPFDDGFTFSKAVLLHMGTEFIAV
ncbi:hypothetical protein DL96DRAFT_1794717 [Flagelloscypha sp. PMI_526]|nr:hypothetical protein DL96DRAFT_1794717 [Flagelloscypha sp. PMI_526]